MSHPFLPDIIAFSLILISILISLVRGLVRELISVVSWILAAWLSIRYSKVVANYITFTDVQSLRVFLAFLLIFVVAVFIGATINFIVGQLVRKTPFSAADRVLGTVFGALRGVLVLSILVLLGGLTPLPKDDWWQQSIAIKQTQKIAVWMQGFLPSEISKYFDFSPNKQAHDFGYQAHQEKEKENQNNKNNNKNNIDRDTDESEKKSDKSDQSEKRNKKTKNNKNNKNNKDNNKNNRD